MMSEAGFLAQKPKSPASLLIVIALHAAAITALAMAKMDVPVMKVFTPLTIRDVPVNPDPPPVPPEPAKESESFVESSTPLVKVPAPPDPPVVLKPLPWTPPLPGPITIDKPVDPPKPEPVRVGAEMSPRSEVQPPYPASEQRMGREGSVAIRLLIGADGRVKAAEKVRATSDAFYRTTERHALTHWRFTPASVDGEPVESWKTLTVHFQLNG